MTQHKQSHRIKWLDHHIKWHDMHQNRSHHHHGTAEASFTAKKWFGHRAGRSPCAHSIGKFFLCYIVLFSSETSTPGSPGNYLYTTVSKRCQKTKTWQKKSDPASKWSPISYWIQTPMTGKSFWKLYVHVKLWLESWVLLRDWNPTFEMKTVHVRCPHQLAPIFTSSPGSRDISREVEGHCDTFSC